MDRKQNYIKNLFAPEDNNLLKALERTKKTTEPIQISPTDGKFLQLIIKLGSIKNIVEIGTLGGYSSLWISKALPNDGHLYTIELDDERFALAQKSLKNISNITQLHGNAKKILPTLEDKAPFDMIFIDADKRQYNDYLDWAELHIRKGGIIIADNTLLSGSLWLEENEELPYRIKRSTVEMMKKFNARLADPQKYCGTLLPTKDGITLAVKLF